MRQLYIASYYMSEKLGLQILVLFRLEYISQTRRILITRPYFTWFGAPLVLFSRNKHRVPH